jgi:chromosome segregation protein
VIDAVRWVLGESRASALRGDTMQDVIFNGAGERKPVGRASVELVFDNSLGRAGGQWGQYSEIAIRRVLARDGESFYYINNQHVRRRDVADIFLGTGLGGRGYAIIEQGMISQIIEAKPEDLRVFLEEAAGVSKYRERRRETELRLGDSRENLLRVNDILEELNTQVQRLGEQARVASHYHELQRDLKTSQHLLWMVRRNDAGAQRARIEREVRKTETELEAEMARLREAEKRLEIERQRHYESGETLHRIQGELYSANAEVSRIEQQLDYLRTNRQRVQSQLSALRDQIGQQESQQATLAEELASWRVQRLEATEVHAAARGRAEAQAERLPGAEAAFREHQERLNELERGLMLAEQSRELQETHRGHAERTLAQLEGRRQRLQEEQASLPKSEAAELDREGAELSAVEAELTAKDEALAGLLSRLPGAAETRKSMTHAVQAGEHQLTELEARIAALEQLQRRLEKSESLGEWLDGHGIGGLPRLWQRIHIEDGWEDALEAALRDRLNALLVERLDAARGWGGDVPPVRLTLLDVEDGASEGAGDALPGLTALRSLVTSMDSALDTALDEWLHGVHVAEDLAQALELRNRLRAGYCLVTRQGHVVTRRSMTYYAPESDLHGVLGRQREIEELQQEMGSRLTLLGETRSRLAAAERAVEQLEADVENLRTQTSELRACRHELQMDVLRLTQQSDQVRGRNEQIERELQEIGEQSIAEGGRREAAAAQQAQFEVEVGRIRNDIEGARAVAQSAETALQRSREAAQSAVQEAQAASFSEQQCILKINEIENTVKVVYENVDRLRESQQALVQEENSYDESPVATALQGALAIRQQKEQDLAAARDALEGVAAALRDTEQERLGIEHRLGPLRDRINELKLKEQEARLNAEQYAEQLGAAGADEAALEPLLLKNPRPTALQGEINRLNEEIAALGAVNLAALDELTASQERKAYLDSQSADLTEAMATLEAAIKRIDRETRERLMATFDEVNGHLGELFPALFGGGQARLELTGEEILDSGVQLIAQPPGKRNASIHLLSGGEKALVALALVFSIFKLNPAPFCLLDEVDAPLDDPNTERFCDLVKRMSEQTQFMFISHNKITMEIAEQLVGVTMQEQGVSHVVAVDIEEAIRMREQAA